MRRISGAARCAAGAAVAAVLAAAVAAPASAVSNAGAGVLVGTMEYAPSTLLTCEVLPLSITATGAGTDVGPLHDEYTGVTWKLTVSGASTCGSQALGSGQETGEFGALDSVTGSTFACPWLSGGFVESEGAIVLGLSGVCTLNGNDLGTTSVVVSGSQVDGPAFAGSVVVEG